MRSLPTGPVEDSSSALFPVGRRGPYPGRTTPVGGLRMAQVYSHAPVLVDEVARLLSTVPPGVVIDGTLGAGGHAAAILDRRDDVVVLGLDRDPEAIAAGSEALERYGRRAIARQARFSTMASALQEAKDAGLIRTADPVVGVLLDLGVSSHQLDTSARGFSYRNEGPLDMRMGPDDGPTAAEFLRDVDEDTLTAILVANGERRFGRGIAKSILASSPSSTAELATAVERAVPAAARRHGHVASRTFQALRIAVNRELEELESLLASLSDVVVEGGVAAIISFHSLEDRLVKRAFHAEGWEQLTKKPVMASDEEQQQNARSRSAKLRAAHRVAVPQGDE